MRTRTLLIPAVLLLAACSAPAEEPTPAPEPVAEAEPSEEVTEEPSEETTTEATADPTAPPEQCVADDNIGPVWEALERAVAAPALAPASVDTAVRLLEDWEALPVWARREGLRSLVESVEVDFPGGKRVDVTTRPLFR